MSLDVHIEHTVGTFRLDVEFTVDRPGITALFGPSGSGKTTTVDALAGLLRPDSASILIDGTPLVDTGANLFVSARDRGIGYVFQDSRLFPHMSVQSNLLFGARRSRGRASHTTFDEAVGLLGLSALLDRRPGTLSGGERQRVAIGRALLSSPRVLLLDEPLAALDRERKEEILDLLRRLRDIAGIPMIYVSHAIDEVTRLADDVVVLRQGRVVAQGSIFDVMAQPELFPRSSDTDAGAVVAATVLSVDPEMHLTELALDGGRIWVPRLDAATGDGVRVRILARDVMLAVSEPKGISANNVLGGRVTAIHPTDGAGVDVQLACGSTRLLARITHRSLARLGLVPGMDVYAVIKSVAVDRRSA